MEDIATGTSNSATRQCQSCCSERCIPHAGSIESSAIECQHTTLSEYIRLARGTQRLPS